MDVSLLRQRLHETVEWCVPRFSMDDLENSLRTPPAPPMSSIQMLFEESLQTLREHFENVVQKRTDAINSGPESHSDLLAGGRILAVSLTSTCDNTSPPASDNFIDGCDLPPWDTWVYWLRGESEDHLLCWIPPVMITRVQFAIDVNAIQFMNWLDKADHLKPQAVLLRNAGIR